jgi:hypothetical protein
MAPPGGAATGKPSSPLLCDALGRPIPGTGADASGSGGAGAGGVLPDGSAGGLPSGPSWQPLVLLAPPGLQAIVDTVSPPLQIIAAVLSVIAALLDVLAAILIGLPDLYRALIMAAYTALKGLIEDIINAGFYLYFDAPGITSLAASPSETNLFGDRGLTSVTASPDQIGLPTAQPFVAGMNGGPPPQPTPDRYAQWAARFAQSFDDPGDDQRPQLSTGAMVSAVFIAAAAPSLDALRQALYLLGMLFNIQPFIDALDKFKPRAPDPDLTMARQSPIAPDWYSARLQDLFPPLRGLLAIPEALKALLLPLDGLTGLIAALVAAIKAKVKTLQDLVAVIQAIIALLDALKSAGLYVLPVSTDQGVVGLKAQFAAAQNRPPGGFMAGVCLLAAGPGIPGAATLFNMLGQGGALTTLENALTEEQNLVASAGASLDQTIAALDTTAAQATQDLVSAVEASPIDFAGPLGMSAADAIAAARSGPAAFAAKVAASNGARSKDPVVQKLLTWSQHASKKGARSLAFAFGPGPDKAQPGPPPPAPPAPLANPDDPCGNKTS